ncbi:MAG: N-acetylglucosamine kinase [Xanthomonadaceae bacterium]|nr:N-acetylglucosamine kinase [Xanthomonadaceae bacterium]
MRGCYLGVDGGGTTTRFLLVDADLHPLAEAELGTTWFPQVGIDGAAAVLEQGIAQVLSMAGADADTIQMAFFGLPAYGENAQVARQLDTLPQAILGHARYRCGNDMLCGWAGSLACADGINLIAGTGSMGYGQRGGLGQRAGGWGDAIGDEGSAHWIAVQGLNAFSRMSDGRLPKGPLHAIVRQVFALENDLALCAHVYGDAVGSRTDIARMAALVLAAAQAGDAQAQRIYQAAGDELARIAIALRSALAFAPGEPVPVSYSGGAFHAGEWLLAPLRNRLHAAATEFDLRPPLHSPVMGAALYAQHLARVR